MLPPLARTTDEAYLYMMFSPCPCGEAEFDPTSSLNVVDGAWVVRYQGTCDACGSPRVFQFRQPDELALPDEGQWAVGDQPSELLDAGQWLRISDIYASTPAETAGLSDVELDDRRTDLLAAAAAFDEVLKFLPPGADEMPDSAFWSHLGRQVRLEDPGRFQRLRLEAAREVYRRLVAEVGGPR